MTSAGERQPRSASAFSVSSRRISSTCSTPSRAAEGEPVQRRPADEHGASSERERHHDVGSAPNATVEVHLGAVADGVDDLGQRLERRDRAVELTTAVVRDDDAGGAVLAGEDRVLGGDEALHEHGHLPALAELGDVVPLESRLEQAERSVCCSSVSLPRSRAATIAGTSSSGASKPVRTSRCRIP